MAEERDALTVGRPDRVGVEAFGCFRKLERRAHAHLLHVDVAVAVPRVPRERDSRAVGRQGRSAFVAEIGGHGLDSVDVAERGALRAGAMGESECSDCTRRKQSGADDQRAHENGAPMFVRFRTGSLGTAGGEVPSSTGSTRTGVTN